MKEKNKKIGAEATTNYDVGNNTTKKSFNELLKDKYYQSEFDKKISKALQTAKAKWEKEKAIEINKGRKQIKSIEEILKKVQPSTNHFVIDAKIQTSGTSIEIAKKQIYKLLKEVNK